MTDNTIAIYISGFTNTLGIVATLIVSLMNGKKTDEVHTMVNNNLSEVKRDLTAALARTAKLERLLIRLTKDPALIEAAGMPSESEKQKITSDQKSNLFKGEN